MPGEFLILSCSAFLAVFCLMAITFAFSQKIRNAGIVDVVWSAGFAPVALYFALASSGNPLRRAMVATMVALWSLRLGSYLFVRVKGHHPQEDRRYSQLRLEWGAQADRKMFWFFQLQGGLLMVLSVPFLLASLNARSSISWIEWFGLFVWGVGLIGESAADDQLKKFKADPANRGKVCQAGLWQYSRHPNYFFEWVIWVAFFLFASGSHWGWITIYCPALMLFFLLRVTGIPMTEELAVKTKGDAYREYQRATSSFVPWFKRTTARGH